MPAVKTKPKMKKPVVRIAKPVNRVVTTSPAKLKAALPKRPKCRTDGKTIVLDDEDGKPRKIKFVCTNPGRSRGLCVNHYNMLCRLVRRGDTTWEEQEKRGLVLPAGKHVVRSEGALLFLSSKKKTAKKKK